MRLRACELKWKPEANIYAAGKPQGQKEYSNSSSF